ncbi:MAG: GTP 3',8-cyclase MoaA [Candidatus Adiutrix sp.]|jgi:cyclic pyranopterin phosphate synthase|nr:GTP 3',8-cyclase MoaA [Candidatus Adiutrix sp.]
MTKSNPRMLGEHMTRELTASGGRRLTYLRMSVTDLCNLRCGYCMPPEGVPKLRHHDILTFEEMARLAAVAAGLGMTKLRLTGGEPLVRRGLSGFIRRLGEEGFTDLRLTTNGLLLAPMAAELKAAGLRGLNISLDALEPAIYAQLCGLPGPEGLRAARQAWEGFQAALACGFDVKINCVPIRGVNDGQLLPLARLALEYPIDVRFIEHMPIGDGRLWNADRFMSAAEVYTMLADGLGTLTPAKVVDPSAPARLYRPAGAPGAVGFISPLSGHFCGDCNRLRLTADGKMKPCLLTGQELDLRAPLRAGADDQTLAALFSQAACLKPLSHLAADDHGGRQMNRIGG